MLKAKGLERTMQVVDSACDSRVVVHGRSLLNLCSNNYLGLAADERLRRAAVRAVRTFGVGAGASRLVAGNTSLHKRLEEKLARFKKQQACLVYPTGYSTNLGIIASLAGRSDIVFCDRLNHASIIDGIILSRAELVRYPHKGLDALERLLRKSPARKRKLIVTDTVFSMDGDIAPIPA
ncbi:MAG: aminotransferase class I/II-fold pyridoxal phosphate-dependent enzyme, partial [Armatimonadetes bacterium]|nr:aminotransferase class I/II-fold pyridoxal phosphate-dependent enzyme [Armatimonadota bacterium]NIM67227.1 aminotransferase class I/II-fold pyridoxal phosphate-dependent enzyme [Armatimonadota bacterium]NIO96601.1 aminotransferase class I/II-fold pyridoxal phosphate-dependent enzyme [Armatimonadota bacterium]